MVILNYGISLSCLTIINIWTRPSARARDAANTDLKHLAVVEEPAVALEPGHGEPGEPVAACSGATQVLALPHHHPLHQLQDVLVGVQVTTLIVNTVTCSSCCCGGCCCCSCCCWCGATQVLAL